MYRFKLHSNNYVRTTNFDGFNETLVQVTTDSATTNIMVLTKDTNRVFTCQSIWKIQMSCTFVDRLSFLHINPFGKYQLCILG